jgi:hypothetical protein
LFNNTQDAGDPRFRPLYAFIEGGSSRVTHAELESYYHKVDERAGSAATATGLRGLLRTYEQSSQHKAIDLLISLHGSDGALWFFDGAKRVQDLATEIVSDRAQGCNNDANCIATRKKKLRFVYSMACYGKTHVGPWIAAGFRVAAGPKQVSADSAASFPTFLRAWRSGYSFKEAVDRANSADSRRLWDNWAKLNPDWREANSVREYAGDSNATFIWSKR